MLNYRLLEKMKTIVFGVILYVLFFPLFQLSAQERVELSHDQLMPGLEYFIDGVAKSYMADKEIAGLQISIVKDNKVLFLKGYGIARLAPLRDVDPCQSLFRIGSISKTFTWISLMQLKERGQIKLTDPVNKFLPEPLLFSDEGFKKPILIIDLMNHTPGLEDLTQNIYVEKDEDLLSLVSYLAKYRPRRVREAGELTAYSNYGAALGVLSLPTSRGRISRVMLKRISCVLLV